MSDCRKITQNITNPCKRPVRGLVPSVLWAYRDMCNVTLTDNVVSGFETILVGEMRGTKFGFNAGSEEVGSDNMPNGFRHTFSGVFHTETLPIDRLEDIIIFVRPTGSTSYIAYGVENGLWKDTQVKSSNENNGVTTVEMGSREGMEEEFSEYPVTADLSVLPNATTHDIITGLTISTGDDYSINAELLGIQLPDKTFIFTDEIDANTFDPGYPITNGEVYIAVSKANSEIDFSNSDFGGVFKTQYAGIINLFGCVNISGVEAFETINIQLNDMNLSASAIEILLAGLVARGNVDGYLYIEGGTTAAYAELSTEGKADFTTLVSRGWTIIDNS